MGDDGPQSDPKAQPAPDLAGAGQTRHQSNANDGGDGKVVSLGPSRVSRSQPADPRLAAQQAPEAEDDGHNPLALALGAAVIVLLLLGAWWIIGSMKCNPLFSDAGLSRSASCR